MDTTLCRATPNEETQELNTRIQEKHSRIKRLKIQKTINFNRISPCCTSKLMIHPLIWDKMLSRATSAAQIFVWKWREPNDTRSPPLTCRPKSLSGFLDCSVPLHAIFFIWHSLPQSYQDINIGLTLTFPS